MTIDKNTIVFGSDAWLKFSERDLFPNERYAFEKMGITSSTGLKIADLGCGSGRVSERIAAFSHTVKALDVSKEIIRKETTIF